MSMLMLSPGDSLMQGYVADRERDDFNASETARVIKERGYEPGVLYDNDFLIPEDEAERVENEEPGLDRSGGIYADDNAFMADGVMRDASRILHDFNYKIGAYDDPNRTFPSGIARAAAANRTQSVAQRTDDAIAEYGLEAGGALNYHLETQALTAFSDQPDEVKLAIAALLDGYEQLPDGTRAGSMRMFKGMALSPTTYLGLGSIGAIKNLLQFGGKQAAKRTLRDRLLRTVLGAQFIGAEGAGYAAFSDYAMQKNEAGDEPFKLDTTRLATAAGMGYGFGAALTGAVAVAPSAVKAGAGMVRDMTRPGLRSGVGPIPEGEASRVVPDEIIDTRNMPDEMGFRSGVYTMLDDLPEGRSGDELLATLNDPQRLGKYGVKKEELELLGLPQFLRGKESVSKDEIRDFIEANRVRLDEANTSAGDAVYEIGEPTQEYVARNFEELRGDNNTRPYEISVSDMRSNDPGEDIDSVLISQFFDIDSYDDINDVFADVDLVARNDADLMVGARDPEFDADLAEAMTGERDANYVRPDVQEALDKAEAAVGDFPRFEGGTHGERMAVQEAFAELDEVTNGAVYRSMESNSKFHIIGEGGSPTNWNYDIRSYDEAVDVARRELQGTLDDQAPPYAEYTYPGTKQNYAVHRVLIPEDDPRFPELRNVGQHFESNTFASIRSSDRGFVTEGGQRLDGMFVEEMQSDAAQQFNKRGIKTELADVTEVEARAALKSAQESFLGANRNAFDTVYDVVATDADGQGAAGIFAGNRDLIFGDIMNAAVEGRLPLQDVNSSPAFNDVMFFADELISRHGAATTMPLWRASQAVAEALVKSIENLTAVQKAEFSNLETARKTLAAVGSGIPDFPMRRNWLEITTKAAIARAVKERPRDGEVVIAFPATRETVAEIQQYSAPRDNAISRTYEKDLPKVLKKLARLHGGTVEMGNIQSSKVDIAKSAANEQTISRYEELNGIADRRNLTEAESNEMVEIERWAQSDPEAEVPRTRIEGSGGVIILRLSDPQKVSKEGFALPSVAVGATAATGAAMQNEKQPASERVF